LQAGNHRLFESLQFFHRSSVFACETLLSILLFCIDSINQTIMLTYMLKEKRMQQPPTGYGQSPQWYGQPQQQIPPNAPWVQQPYAPYPPQQGYPPQQPYPPQQGQWQQQFPPNPQWSAQTYWQAPTPPPPTVTQKPVNVVKSLLIVFGLIAVIIAVVMVLIIYSANQGTAPSTTLSEP
jgi:hypothetical protein